MMTLTETGWALAALGLALAGALAGGEAALGGLAQGRLKTQAEKGDRRAALALALAESEERSAAALRLGQVLAVAGAAGLAGALAMAGPGLFGLRPGLIALAWLALLALGLALPRALARAEPAGYALALLWLLRPAVALLAPATSGARRAAAALLRLFGLAPDREGRIEAVREDIAGAIALGHSEGAVEKDDRDRLLGALHLGERTVEEVMRHRRDIERIDADDDPAAILTQVLASSHTRLPVFRGDAENIIGVIHAKDLLREVAPLLSGENPAGLAGLDPTRVAKKPYFVPETTPLDEQMREFLKRRTHFALVVDEYGALQGMITLEDILEEIVGDITDEFDVVQKGRALRPDDAGDYLLDGAMPIRDLNRAMDWALPDDEANTIAGLVIHEAQMIPQEGQVFRFHGFRFEIVARRETRITRLKLRPI